MMVMILQLIRFGLIGLSLYMLYVVVRDPDADSGRSRASFRDDAAHRFRDDFARRSKMMSPTIPG